MKKLFTSDSGQTVVEMVLVMPLLFALLLGAMEYGRLWYIKMEVTNAANAAAQYGAQNHGTASDIAGMQSVATNEGSNILSLKPSGLTATVVPIPCKCSDGSSCAVPPATPVCAASAHSIDYVHVDAQADVDSLFNRYFTVTPYHLTGHATVRVRQ